VRKSHRELEYENEDALKLKEILDERIHYQKLVSQLPLYGSLYGWDKS
jgi:hypothetical protein